MDIELLDRPDGPRVEVCRPRRDVLQLVLHGEHDLASAAALMRILEAAVTGTSHLVIDVSQAEFIDSTTINTLMHSCRRAEEAGVHFNLLIRTRAAVRRAFEITGVLEMLNAVGSLDEALVKQDGAPPKSPETVGQTK